MCLLRISWGRLYLSRNWCSKLRPHSGEDQVIHKAKRWGAFVWCLVANCNIVTFKRHFDRKVEFLLLLLDTHASVVIRWALQDDCMSWLRRVQQSTRWNNWSHTRAAKCRLPGVIVPSCLSLTTQNPVLEVARYIYKINFWMFNDRTQCSRWLGGSEKLWFTRLAWEMVLQLECIDILCLSKCNTCAIDVESSSLKDQ